METVFLQAQYANSFRVGRNEHEMILDFGQVNPEGTEQAFHTRIITAAANGRALARLLSDAADDYENCRIPDTSIPDTSIPDTPGDEPRKKDAPR